MVEWINDNIKPEDRRLYQALRFRDGYGTPATLISWEDIP
jgi:hypothetical protein